MKLCSLLRRWLDRIKRKDAAPPPPKPAEAKAATAKKKNTGSSFESLENRIAPAILVNATTVTYADLDGDLVTVKFSKPVFTGSPAAALLLAERMFTFKDATGATTHITGNNGVGEQLQLLSIDTIVPFGTKNPLSGASLSITATKQNGIGNDLTDVGAIRATGSNASLGTPLGNVTIDGDLGKLDVGASDVVVGLKSLTVQSIGAAGLSTQADGGSLKVRVFGALKKLVVKDSIVDATLTILDGSLTTVLGNIGSISIGGALTVSAGDLAPQAGSIMADSNIGTVNVALIVGGDGSESGRIEAGGTIGSVIVGGDIRGGAGEHSGEIAAEGAMGSIRLDGSLWAGSGDNSGRISGDKSIRSVTIQNLHGDLTIDGAASGMDAGAVSAAGKINSFIVRDSIFGGAEDGTGYVFATGSISTLSVGGSIIGGDGENSGRVDASQIGSVTIGKVLAGGDGATSGSITSASSIGKITIKNVLRVAAAMVAGTGDSSGSIIASAGIGPVNIAGGIDATIADAGTDSASIQAGAAMGAVKIGGSISGGSGIFSGSIATGGAIGAVQVFGSITGGAGNSTGSIIASGRLASLSVTGAISGGAGADSGSIIIGLDPDIAGDMGRTSILGGLFGAGGLNSGSIRAFGKISDLTLGAKVATPSTVVLGGSGEGSGTIFSATGIAKATINGNVTGGDGANSAGIFTDGAVSRITITGGLHGGLGGNSASLRAFDRFTETGIVAGSLGTVRVGNLVGGDGAGSGQILADGSLKSLIAGQMTGGAGAGSGSILIGQGQSALDDDFASIGGAKAITIRGGIAAGTGQGSATVETGGSLGKLSVDGATTGATILIGRDLGSATFSGPVSGTLVSAFGQSAPTSKSDVAIGKLTVDSDVSDSRFLAGYDRFGNAANGNAQVGTLTVSGDWTASSLVAGVRDVNADGFGNADDTVIAGGTISRIASIVIAGGVTGTAANGDHFGFVAQTIGKARIGGAALPLTAGKDIIPLAGSPATDDTALREVP